MGDREGSPCHPRAPSSDLSLPCFSGLFTEECDGKMWPKEVSTGTVPGVESKTPRGELRLPLPLPALTLPLFHKLLTLGFVSASNYSLNKKLSPAKEAPMT